MEDPRPSINSPDARLLSLRPLYMVACPVTSDPAIAYEPIVHGSSPDDHEGTTSFDAELMPILPAVWYALHLPKTRFEVLDLSLLGIRESLRENRRHHILLLPAYLLHDHTRLAALAQYGEPMLILCTDEHLEAAKTASTATGVALPPVSTTGLSQEMLEEHWKAMGDHWSGLGPAGSRLNLVPPRWTPDISLQGSALPHRRLLRSLGGVASGVDESEDRCDSAFDLLRLRAWVEAGARLEERAVEPDEAELQIDNEVIEASRRLRVPLSLSLTGVAPRYRRLVRQLAPRPSEGRDDEVSSVGKPRRSAPGPSPAAALSVGDPPEVLSLMVSHRAAGDDSMGVVLSHPVPDAAFLALADLERHWVDGARPKKEEPLRARLDKAMASFWTESMIAAVRSASQIDAFTNFPIGLLRMPGHTAPLAALVPIAYRPINPLTRAFQAEFAPDRIVDLSRGMRVLVVECIPDTDPVGRYSQRVWSLAAAELTEASRSVTVELVSVANKKQFAAALESHSPDVLVISAHGFYKPDANMAGMMIGTEPSLGDDLGPMPPMVILSACHSGPRGAGPVAVSDLLLHAGARAVLSTLVPVRVQHNSTFMSRFLLYMSETIGGVEKHASVLDLWHRVQTNTVIIDILQGNPKLEAWGYSDAGGVPPIVEFMESRSRGRLRPPHLYQDAEAVLLEIAADRDEETAVRGWLRAPGYLPESMMYTFVGDPSCIRLQAPELVAPGPSAPGPSPEY